MFPALYVTSVGSEGTNSTAASKVTDMLKPYCGVVSGVPQDASAFSNPLEFYKLKFNSSVNELFKVLFANLLMYLRQLRHDHGEGNLIVRRLLEVERAAKLTAGTFTKWGMPFRRSLSLLISALGLEFPATMR